MDNATGPASGEVRLYSDGAERDVVDVGMIDGAVQLLECPFFLCPYLAFV